MEVEQCLPIEILEIKKEPKEELMPIEEDGQPQNVSLALGLLFDKAHEGSMCNDSIKAELRKLVEIIEKDVEQEIEREARIEEKRKARIEKKRKMHLLKLSAVAKLDEDGFFGFLDW